MLDLMRLIGQNKISSLLKMQWRQHHYLCTKIAYSNNIMMQRNTQREAEKESSTKVVDQGSQTRGPRTACGPPDAFVWPARISKT